MASDTLGLESVTKRGWKKNPGSEIILPLSTKLRWLLGLWGSCLLYAIVRYNVFEGVEWIHLPLYVVNKSLSFGGIGLVSCSYLVGKWINVYPGDVQRRRALSKFLGLSGFYLLVSHILASLAMLSPVYYEKFFNDTGKLALTGELTVLFGVLAIGWLTFPAITTIPMAYEALGGERWQRAQRMGYVALAFGCAHTFTMGFKGWFAPSTWPGSLPPITMLGFAFALAALIAKATSRKP